MRFTRLQYAAIIALTVACSAASARGILIDNWQPTPPGNFTNSTSATIDFTNTALFGGTLAGISALGFSPGTSTPGFTIATIESNQIEYAFGGSVGMPSEQVIIIPFGASAGSVPSFDLSFGYDSNGSVTGTASGGTGETASLSINGVTYTANNPGSLSETNGVFHIVGGVIENLSDILTGWTSSASSGGGGGGGGGGGTMNAPEIDPASAASALTLLLGGLTILASRQRKPARNAP
jgi:hypothetical protein